MRRRHFKILAKKKKLFATIYFITAANNNLFATNHYLSATNKLLQMSFLTTSNAHPSGDVQPSCVFPYQLITKT